MICPSCDGNNEECFECNGVGELCDICGEAAPDFGINVCAVCAEKEEEA